MKIALSLVAALATLTALPAAAQGYYAAKFATPPSKSRIVTRSTVWTCTDGLCTAARGDDRPAVLCELAAKTGGTLESFSAGGTAFDPDALAKCNARAK